MTRVARVNLTHQATDTISAWRLTGMDGRGVGSTPIPGSDPASASYLPYFSCDQCGYEFDPIACRWRCPACSWKASCCEGAPL